MNISETHKQTVIETFKSLYLNEARLPPNFDGFFVTTRLGRAIAKFLGSRRAASAIAGASLGISADFLYHLVKGAWSRIEDWVDGQSVDIKDTAKYADMVNKHSDAVTKAMIRDMSIAIEDKNWIKVAKIQRYLMDYGHKVGYDYETRREKTVNEDGGAAGGLGGGAPTNNVGSGHIAGAAGDPPGPRTYLRRKMMIRRKRPLGESLKHGSYALVGYTFNPKPVRHYAAVNKRGKYLHTTSEKVARRHAHSGGLHEARIDPKHLFRLTHIFHKGEPIGQIKSLSDVHFQWTHTAGSNSRGVAPSYEAAHEALTRTHLKHIEQSGEEK